MSSSSADYPSPAAAALDVSYHSIASLTFLIWHYSVTLDDEVEYIWTMHSKNIFKWIYIFLRYVVILVHVTHNCLIKELANGSNPPVLCNIWYDYVILLPQILATLLEFILASRIFALYNRSKRIAFILLALILGEATGTVRMLWLQYTTDFHGTCLLIRLTENSGYQSTLAFILHCTFIGLTWFKYFFALKAGWGRTPVVSLIVRDGSTVYAGIIFLLVSVVVLFGLKNERGIAVLFWSTSLISVTGCRMIVSMERLVKRHISIESCQLQRTSEINLT